MGGGVGGAGGGGIPGARAAAAGRERVAPEFRARKSPSAPLPPPVRPHARSAPPPTPGPPGREEKMVVLRSSLELHGHSAASAASSLDLSSEFLSLERIGRRRLRSARAAEQPAVPAAAEGVSTGRGGPRGRAGGALPEGSVFGWGPGAGGRPGDSWRAGEAVGRRAVGRGRVKMEAPEHRSPAGCGSGEDTGKRAEP